MVQLAIQKCLDQESLCNEFYLQLIKQTTDQPEPNGRINIQNWRFLCLICGVVVPKNRVILSYLQTHLRRCGMESHTEEGRYAQFTMQVSHEIISAPHFISSVCLPVCLHVCIVYLPVCLSACLSGCLPACLHCLSVCLSLCSICLQRLSVFLSVCLSV